MLLMPRKKVETEQVNVRISSVLLSRLEKIGEPFGLTRTQMVLRAVEEYVLRHDPQFDRPTATGEPPRPHHRR